MRSFEISPDLQKVLDKLASKDRALAIAVNKKIKQILFSDDTAIEHFKNLKGEMSDLKRVHVGSFVLTFRMIGDKVFFESFTHHDGAY